MTLSIIHGLCCHGACANPSIGRPCLHLVRSNGAVQENEYAGAADAAPILLVDEAERYVEDLREFSLEEIASGR